MSEEYTNIRVERPEPGIAVVSFARPESMNAWTNDLIDELIDFINTMKSDYETTVLIMRGDGEKGYCSGADFNDLFPVQVMSDTVKSYDLQNKLCDMLVAIRKLPQVIINLAFGHTIGGGFFLAMAADIRIIADNVKFSVPLLKLGLGCADLGSSYYLMRQIGSGVAKDILFTGRPLMAEEAMRLGFASECVPFDQLDEAGLAKARLIAQSDPLAVRLSKEALNFAQDSQSFEETLAFENRNQQMIQAYSIAKMMRAKKAEQSSN
ncbi:MAG: enoyl-CoA hydratase/isomerase family protein [Coriobacteriia bacterium]|nr:enoyl-CoA hydratase/isomerase family protein [Coriobacteriia bacterium]MCL2749817.1 enoyl-CoA hydratase/isomerase family protein [Coriobacteriia bacterium]